MIKQLQHSLSEIRKIKPLIMNLTNYVTMDFVANCVLSIGAAPIMSCCEEEMDELMSLSGALNINIGTLDRPFISLCEKAIESAKRYNKPIVLDPVGSGASKIRTETAREFAKHVNIIKGNASEVASLCDNDVISRGVESTLKAVQVKDQAKSLAQSLGCVVIASGEIDYITDGKRQANVPYGSMVMEKVTGMGCALSAVVATFAAIQDDLFAASKESVNYFGLCGKAAEYITYAPAKFRVEFIDNLHNLNISLFADAA